LRVVILKIILIVQLEIGPNASDILATPRIDLGKGVCGESWEKKKTMLVKYVNECKNYIACDNETQSEIVVPVIDENSKIVTAVLDVDSTVKEGFDEVDQHYLELIVQKYLN